MILRAAVFGVAAVSLGALTARSEQTVCLTSGFCLRADSSLQKEGKLWVRMGAGTLEFPAAEVAKIEQIQSEPSRENSTAGEGPSRNRVPPADPEALLAAAARTTGVDADFVRSVARIESDLKQEALSRKGAMGLMQLMPGTAKELAIDPAKADENALGGARYLRSLLLLYGNNSALALAAYNAGPGAVKRFGGVPPYRETRDYVCRVTREYDRLRAARVKVRSHSALEVSRPTARD